jgi:hypothetical protein
MGAESHGSFPTRIRIMLDLECPVLRASGHGFTDGQRTTQTTSVGINNRSIL